MSELHVTHPRMCRSKHPTQQYDRIDAVLPKICDVDLRIYPGSRSWLFFWMVFPQRLWYDSRGRYCINCSRDYLAFMVDLTSKVYIEYLHAYADTGKRGKGRLELTWTDLSWFYLEEEHHLQIRNVWLFSVILPNTAGSLEKWCIFCLLPFPPKLTFPSESFCC